MADDPVAEFLAREDGALDDDVVAAPPGRGASPASSIHSNNYMQEEPESIKVWREQQQKLIKEKDEAEEKQKSELREQAKKELEAWHRQRERDVVERKKKNRVQEEQLLKEGAQAQKEGKAAQDLASLVDSGKTPPKNAPDTSRMRALLLEGGETTA